MTVVTTYAPFTGAAIAAHTLSTPEDVTRAYAVARAAQVDWARRPVAYRAGVLQRLHDLVGLAVRGHGRAGEAGAGSPAPITGPR